MNSLCRKTSPVLDAPEAFFFEGCDEVSIFEEHRRYITVIGINAKYIHISEGNRVHKEWGRDRFFIDAMRGEIAASLCSSR
jgi:hypothetical protein